MRKHIFLTLVMVGSHVCGAENRDRVSYQGVEIRPGDVINLRGGLVTAASSGAAAAIHTIAPSVNSLTYGHTALYLGINPQNGQRTFLDFTTSKDRTRPFLGRLLFEKEFLEVSGNQHTEFDVFRLGNVSGLNQHELLQEAKRVSIRRTFWEHWWGVSNVCVNAVTQVLSKATGMKIDFISPDGFMQPPFQRLPELSDRSINIKAALAEVKTREDFDARAAQMRRLTPQIVAAQRQAKRTELTAEEAALAREYAKDELNRVKADYVSTVVNCACSDPNSLAQLDSDGRVPGTTVEFVYLKAYYLNERGHLSGCAIGLFEKILHDSPNLVSVPSMTEWARDYRWKHSLAHQISNTIKKFGDSAKHLQEAIGDALASSGSSDSSSSTSSGSSHSSTGSGSSIHFSSSAYNQASGINAAGHW